METFKQITPYRFEYSKNLNVPIVFHLQPSLFPGEEALRQLEGIAKTEDIFHHIAVLSDVHPKEGRKCPTGVAVACKKILPQIMDTAPNCGMRMFTLSKKASEISKDQIDSIFKQLVKVVPTKTYKGVTVSMQTVAEICRSGVKGALNEKDFSFLEDEIANSFQNGNEFLPSEIPTRKDIGAVLPRIFRFLASYRLGILGMAGNHFLDLMKVEKITDPESAKKFGLEEDQLVFFMHTGSGILGQYASYFYTPKKEEHFSTKVLVTLGRMTLSQDVLTKEELRNLQKNSVSYRDKEEFFSIDPESRVGRAYYLSHRASGNFGYANRAILSAQIKSVVERELGKALSWRLIYDMPHIGLRHEEHYGEKVWIHRNGVSRAFGPERMKDHSVFSETGEPCFFAGSMTTPSYLAVAENGNDSTFFSASHGAGKKKDLPESFSKEQLLERVGNEGIKLYNARSKGVVKQHSTYYKNIDDVMEGVKENKIARPVARLKPIAVLMA